MSIINSEIQQLKSKKVIVNSSKRIGDYIFDICTRSKKDGSHRVILNFNNFNIFNILQAFQNGVNTKYVKYDLKRCFYGIN